MDANSKNKHWNSNCTDDTERELEIFLCNNNLKITNVNKSKLDYIQQSNVKKRCNTKWR